MVVAINIILKRLRRKGVDIKSTLAGAGRASSQWVLSGGAIINGRSELAEYARGVGVLGAKDEIGPHSLPPVVRAQVDETPSEAQERFAQTLAGLVFDLSFDGQRDVWRDAIRTAPAIRNTRAYRSWRSKNTDRLAVEHFGLN